MYRLFALSFIYRSLIRKIAAERRYGIKAKLQLNHTA